MTLCRFALVLCLLGSASAMDTGDEARGAAAGAAADAAQGLAGLDEMLTGFVGNVTMT